MTKRKRSGRGGRGGVREKMKMIVQFSPSKTTTRLLPRETVVPR